MKILLYPALTLLLFFSSSTSKADEDLRELVNLPEMMQQHMMSNMRDHLETINKILIYLSNDEIDKAAEIAEKNLGMSSLSSHGASHMGKYMPQGMREAGTTMHRAATNFALKAQVENSNTLYKALTKVTSACVACHSGYRIR